MPTLLLAVTMALGLAGGMLAPGPSPLVRQVTPSPLPTAFVFDAPAPRSFWMRGMQFCIDIIWIENGVIQGAAESVCPEPPGTADADLPSYFSPIPVTYVLEVPAGWLNAHGLGAGMLVEGLPSPVMR